MAGAEKSMAGRVTDRTRPDGRGARALPIGHGQAGITGASRNVSLAGGGDAVLRKSSPGRSAMGKRVIRLVVLLLATFGTASAADQTVTGLAFQLKDPEPANPTRRSL